MNDSEVGAIIIADCISRVVVLTQSLCTAFSRDLT